MLSTNRETHNRVYMSLWYSRLITSNEDYERFFGFSPDETNIPRVEYQFDAMVAEELDSLQPLPDPFDVAYKLCRSGGVSQKWRLHCVRLRSPRNMLPTEVERDGLSMPAVLIGNAAHAIPETLSAGDISCAMMDAVDLCRMIVERYDTDVFFNRISKDFYKLKYNYWRKLSLDWEQRWKATHGLPPYGSSEVLPTWVAIERTQHLPPREDMIEIDPGSTTADTRRQIRRFQAKEEDRWRVVQQRIRDRYHLIAAFKTRPGVKPTKLVLRYTDSKTLPPHKSDRKNDEQHYMSLDNGPPSEPLVKDKP